MTDLIAKVSDEELARLTGAPAHWTLARLAAELLALRPREAALVRALRAAALLLHNPTDAGDASFHMGTFDRCPNPGCTARRAALKEATGGQPEPGALAGGEARGRPCGCTLREIESGHRLDCANAEGNAPLCQIATGGAPCRRCADCMRFEAVASTPAGRNAPQGCAGCERLRDCKREQGCGECIACLTEALTIAQENAPQEVKP